MKNITVKINNKDYQVKKLPLGKYAELFNALNEIPKELSKMDKVSTDTFLSQLPKIASVALPELVKVISIATDVTEKEILDEMGIADVAQLVEAIFKANDLELLGEVVGRLRENGKVLAKTGSKA